MMLPTQTGAGVGVPNANAACTYCQEYALTPSTPSNGKLVLFMNGTRGHPLDDIADPTVNFYNAAASLGYHVLSVSYLSEDTLEQYCGKGNDACIFPTIATEVIGTLQPGAATASDIQGITVDEGIADRAVLALQYLVANDPAGGWGAFLTSGATPAEQLVWPQVVAAGHSQGGAHAAAIGKLFPVSRVVLLSSVCEANGYQPSSWEFADAGTWATPPSQFWALDTYSQIDAGMDGGLFPTSGDLICALHLLSWAALEIPSAQQNNDAGICPSKLILGKDTHNESVDCDLNDDNWLRMLQ